MTRLFNPLLVACLTLSVLPALAQDPWEEKFRQFSAAIPLYAPEGCLLHRAPLIGSQAAGKAEGPITVEVAGFVEAAGVHYYLTQDSLEKWIETGADRVWITAPNAQLPPLPKLLRSGVGEDPNSGENVTIEIYEEVVTILPESRWPTAPARITHRFPAAVLAVNTNEAGTTTVDFQLFMNSNADKSAYPFIEPYYGGLDVGMVGASIRLYSNPSVANFRLFIDEASNTRSLLRPGLVFLAGFSEGSLVRLELGGDAYNEGTIVSRLGAPIFRRDENLAFGFIATRITGTGVPLALIPNRIGGADYTQYDLISKMGPPFDEYSPKEYQDGWTLQIEHDLSTTLLAPLYDGRGAPGMLELEGLSLDPVVAGPNPENFSREQYAEFSKQIPEKANLTLFGERWHSILETPLGPIPLPQRVPETEGGEF